jgi:HlyD family secretion protein
MALMLLTLLSPGCIDGTSGPNTWQVKRGEFLDEIRVRGSIEASDSIEIRCEVQSSGPEGTQILWMVPEGTYVVPVPDWRPEPNDPDQDPPDLIVKLDSARLESELIEQHIVCNNSQAALTQSENVYATVKTTLSEYIQGSSKTDRKSLELEMAAAQKELRDAEKLLADSELEYSFQRMSESVVEDRRTDVELARKNVELARLALEVMEMSSQPAAIERLKIELDAAQSALAADRRIDELNLKKLARIQSQLEKCTIRAPAPGILLYAREMNHRDGLVTIIQAGEWAREQQTIALLSDLTKMHLKAMVPEVQAATIQPRMPARIRPDALPANELEGAVESISQFPETGSFSGLRSCQALIAITDELPPRLRPGLTAEAKIRIQRMPDALQVPVDAVLLHDDESFCLVVDEGRWLPRQIILGPTNDNFVVVQGGLMQGDRVVRNAERYRQQVAWP